MSREFPDYLNARRRGCDVFFFFNDTATTEIYTLSLHDALPIPSGGGVVRNMAATKDGRLYLACSGDRKSTRLNSSHSQISYAVFCLKKKKSNRPCQWLPYTQPPLTTSPKAQVRFTTTDD